MGGPVQRWEVDRWADTPPAEIRKQELLQNSIDQLLNLPTPDVKTVNSEKKKLQQLKKLLIQFLPRARYANKDKCDLLQMSIRLSRNDIFDYIMTISDYPLDYKNKFGLTALDTAYCDDYFDNQHRYNHDVSEHYVLELLKREQSSEIVQHGNKLLYRALEECYPRVVNYLIEKGVDLKLKDYNGQNPLEYLMLTALQCSRLEDVDSDELILSLLLSGAEPSVRLFEEAIDFIESPEVEGALALYLCDQYSEIELHLSNVLQFAIHNPELFCELAKCVIKVIPDYDRCHMDSLILMKLDCLKIIAEKFGKHIKGIISTEEYKCSLFSLGSFSFENLIFLLESDLKDAIVNAIVNSVRHDWSSWDLPRDSDKQLEVTERYCFLLSYGLRIKENELQTVFEQFGSCELFEIFLHMDIEMDTQQRYHESIMAVMAYDMTLDFDNFLRKPVKEMMDIYRDVKNLFNYFVHPKLTEKYGRICKIKSSPKVPKLLELARNTFRKHVIQRYKIKTSKELQFILSLLRLCSTYKKIINFETKLYCVK